MDLGARQLHYGFALRRRPGAPVTELGRMWGDSKARRSTCDVAFNWSVTSRCYGYPSCQFNSVWQLGWLRRPLDTYRNQPSKPGNGAVADVE
jgi:hypothetical protein